MMQRDRLIRRAMAVAAAVAVLALALAVPAVAVLPPDGGGAPKPVPPGAPNRTYVALGDSYSSGMGTFRYDLDGGCRRSSRAYAPISALRLAIA